MVLFLVRVRSPDFLVNVNKGIIPWSLMQAFESKSDEFHSLMALESLFLLLFCMEYTSVSVISKEGNRGGMLWNKAQGKKALVGASEGSGVKNCSCELQASLEGRLCMEETCIGEEKGKEVQKW